MGLLELCVGWKRFSKENKSCDIRWRKKIRVSRSSGVGSRSVGWTLPRSAGLFFFFGFV